MVRVHVLDSGHVKIPRRQVEPRPRDALRLPATVLDRSRTDWLAIWCFAVEHPQGLVVIDAGQDPDHKTKWWDLYTRIAVSFDVGEDDRIEARLGQAGLDPAEARYHVFTHLHVDHVGAGQLPDARAIVSAAEWKAATAFGGKLRGYRPDGIIDPQTVDGDHDLYGDGTIRILATPGHTAGHQSVLVTPDAGPRVLITGDAVYSEDALLHSRIDGVGVNAAKARTSIERLRDLCAEEPTVVAPTHDLDAARRVESGQITTV